MDDSVQTNVDGATRSVCDTFPSDSSYIADSSALMQETYVKDSNEDTLGQWEPAKALRSEVLDI
jgi:hypothetical protein